MDERRDDFVEPGDGERDLAAPGDNDLLASSASRPGVEARELALLKGSDFARILLRLRAIHC